MRGAVPVLLIIDSAEGTRTLFAEPEDGGYPIRQIVKFGEPLLIPAGKAVAELLTEGS